MRDQWREVAQNGTGDKHKHRYKHNNTEKHKLREVAQNGTGETKTNTHTDYRTLSYCIIVVQNGTGETNTNKDSQS